LRQAKEKRDNAPVKTLQPDIDPDFAEIFVRDTARTLAELEVIIAKNRLIGEDDIRTYGIRVHGLKSTLAYMKKMDISAIAAKLETMARESNIEVIMSETPAFISSLRSLVEELTPQEEECDIAAADEDEAILHEKLLAIKAACEEYDMNTADDLLIELKGKTWSKPTKELLSAIEEMLLRSSFEKVIETVGRFVFLD
jgi:HPt (histidine-containing phosphotransfer) domain-containing protein